jgi:phage terminase large subunit
MEGMIEERLQITLSGKIFSATEMPVRYVIHQGGTRSGKTYTIVYYLLLYAMKHNNARISIISESLPHLKRGVMRDIQQIISQHDWSVEENKTDHIYTFLNGSFIECFAADCDTKLRGSKRDILFINECNNISHFSFDELDVRTREKCILDYNPVSRFWVHDKLLPMLKETDYIFIKSTYRDNPHLSPAEVANIERRQSNAHWWKVYGEGETGTAEGVVFSNWEITDVLPGKLLGYGIDFGFVHSPTAVIQVNEYEGEIYVKEIVYGTGIGNDELLRQIQHKVDLNALAIADSAEPKSIEYLCRNGWKGLKPAIKGPDSVEFGLNLLLERKINVSKESVNLIKEFRNYVWDTNNDGVKLNIPVKEYDHGIDAIRYLVSYPKKKILAIA